MPEGRPHGASDRGSAGTEPEEFPGSSPDRAGVCPDRGHVWRGHKMYRAAAGRCEDRSSEPCLQHETPRVP